MWSDKLPVEDGIYLTKFDTSEDDADGNIYHVRGGKFYKPSGEEWFCYGGVWKRVGELPPQ